MAGDRALLKGDGVDGRTIEKPTVPIGKKEVDALPEGDQRTIVKPGSDWEHGPGRHLKLVTLEDGDPVALATVLAREDLTAGEIVDRDIEGYPDHDSIHEFRFSIPEPSPGVIEPDTVFSVILLLSARPIHVCERCDWEYILYPGLDAHCPLCGLEPKSPLICPDCGVGTMGWQR